MKDPLESIPAGTKIKDLTIDNLELLINHYHLLEAEINLAAVCEYLKRGINLRGWVFQGDIRELKNPPNNDQETTS